MGHLESCDHSLFLGGITVCSIITENTEKLFKKEGHDVSYYTPESGGERHAAPISPFFY